MTVCKAAAFLSLHLLLAATASAGVIGPSKRADIVANALDSPSHLQQNQGDGSAPEHGMSRIYRHMLVPRNTGRTNGRPDEPNGEVDDDAENTEEQLQRNVLPGQTPPLQPGSESSSSSSTSSEPPLAVPNLPNGAEFPNGQYVPSDTLEDEGETPGKTILLTGFDVAILYHDYVDRIDFSIYSPDENIFYHCNGGLFTGNSISESPNFTPCTKEPSEGVNYEDPGSIAFAVKSARVPAPLTNANPLVLYIKYDNEASENKSWTVPLSIDDSHVELISQKDEALQYHYRAPRVTTFRSLELGHAAENN